MRAIRPPAVAGTFYPEDPARLRAMVEGFLAEGVGAVAAPPPGALIAPHAGYVYSGPVAGRAFAALGAETAQIRRVVIIGPAHFVPIRGIAAPRAEAFRTPLGEVAVDRAALNAILDLPQVVVPTIGRMRVSMRSRSSCPSCSSRWASSRSCRWSWARPRPARWRRSCTGSGTARGRSWS